jgi:RNA methyltransferase, TrmH family
MKHPLFQEALLLTRPAGRKETGCYLIEDVHLVRQALDSPEVKIRTVFATSEATTELTPLCAARGVTLGILSSGLIQKLVGTGYETAISAAAIIEQLVVAPEALLTRKPNAVILCGEAIQDPRNVGVLVRTADALGCAGLLLSEGSAEPYSRAAVRSTTGSILRLPIAITSDLPAALLALKQRGARIIASSGGVASVASSVDLSVRPLVLIVGNEQNGISDLVASASDAVIRLPMSEDTKADSLNVTVAAGMLLYEAIREKTKTSV